MEKGKKPKHFLHQPEYPGGPKAMTEFIYKNLRYPKAALAEGVEGLVVGEVGINHKGEVTEVRLLKRLGFGCDEEAIRVLKKLKFTVERNRGVQVLFHKKIRVQFKKPKAPTVQMQYTVTSSQTPPKQSEQTKPGSYSYTIVLPKK
ncbi:MAG: energy transducer TonB [Saprospiraceae bacterium]